MTLTGTATDLQQGSLSDSIAWRSDRDGPLGSGASISTSILSPGAHVISASVTDSGGLGAQAAITLTVNARPVVVITAPSDGAVLVQSTPVTFSATALDAEQGNLASNVRWSSSKDGFLGTGASISVSLTGRGKHTITASATDSEGAEGSASIGVRVGR